MSVRGHAIFWSVAFAGFIGFVWLFKPVLLPFVLGIAVAYLLNPLVNALEKKKFDRRAAVLLILFGFLALVAAFLAAVMPVLIRELSLFAEELPDYFDRLWAYAEPLSVLVEKYLGGADGSDIKEFASSHIGTAAQVGQEVLGGLAAGGRAAFDVISVLVFMPIVAYFMMKEWPNVTRWAEDLIPRHSRKTVMELLKEIDKKLSGFVRGQIGVAVILGIGYAVALSLAGLKYGFLIGLVSGLLSIIPMVGSVVGLLTGVLVAWFQTGEWTFVAIITAIFLAGQFIEGNILTPKLVGDSVGLHPLWIFFALLAGGALFGIVGMLLAVPVAAVAGVLMAFGIKKYKASPYYEHKKIPPKKKRYKAKKK